MKTIKKIAWIFLGTLLSIFLLLFVIVWVNSPGKLKVLTDESGKEFAGSLTEKGWLEIDSIRQGYFIRSENPENPVILYLHGGPGSPELPLVEATEKGERLEKYFTVCYWEQRGAGMSYHKDISPASATISNFVEDTRAMTEYLKKRFGKNKIYLMGHSWGSYLGVKVIEKYPEYYHAYIGIGQITDQHLSEQLAYRYMMNHAMEIKDKDVIEKLSKYDPDAEDFPGNTYLMNVRTLTMNKYGIGITHQSYSMLTALKDLIMFKGYTMTEKLNYLRGNSFALDHVFHYIIEDNLFDSSLSFDVPVYVIHGFFDYQVSYELAEKWINHIEAPDKALYTFEHSAHSPNMEEQERFVATVCEIRDKKDAVKE